MRAHKITFSCATSIFKLTVMNFKFSRYRMSKRKTVLFVIISTTLSLLLIWKKMHYPSSYYEGVFFSNLEAALSFDPSQIDLSKLMTTDWEMACESHGYDESLYIEKYQKTFPTAGAMQDASWGIIFIKTDGTFYLISSSCSFGVYLEFHGNRCLKKNEAKLFKEINHKHGKCSIVYAGK